MIAKVTYLYHTTRHWRGVGRVHGSVLEIELEQPAPLTHAEIFAHGNNFKKGPAFVGSRISFKAKVKGDRLLAVKDIRVIEEKV